MRPIARIVLIGTVFLGTTIAWLILAGVTSDRTWDTVTLDGEVAELWGQPQLQQAPSFTFHWKTKETAHRTEVVAGVATQVAEEVVHEHAAAAAPSSTDLEVALQLDERRRGLKWFSLYDVSFDGRWTYTHEAAEAGEVEIAFQFPDAGGVYDDFHFVVDGVDRAGDYAPGGTGLATRIAVTPGQVVQLAVAYSSRGMADWRYQPTQGVSRVRDFRLTLLTDFDAIDFPSATMSPSTRVPTDEGWELQWSFTQVVTGMGIGMTLPERVQPGELASALSASAPVSLLFFFLVLFVLDTMRGIGMHPINYLFLAGAFFAFHLLFAYSADHLDAVGAFVLASVVSVALVTSYLRLVVSSRFAFVEAALAQLVYLVGFSLAHFWEGFTGLTVTVLSVVTLFVLMQWTGRVRWATVLAGVGAEPASGELSPTGPLSQPTAGA